MAEGRLGRLSREVLPTSWTWAGATHVQDVAPAIHDVADHNAAAHVDNYQAHDAPPTGSSGSPNVICKDSSSESSVRDNPVYNPIYESSASHGSGSEVEMGKDFQPVSNLILPGVGTP
ncbi:hypothetical protein TIFTF001_003901 [Ficus carica]|uniref:Uncharacterized protein n=1 Tax=Ficus carica TaxID=3494 RepID=A0AA87Z9S7_FICCA|nr:hypothetical protein TIFTF001_003901 [Ficus carica]